MPAATPSTTLDAVNVLLATVGHLPVNSIAGALPPEAALALQTLEEVDREVASRGWHFNTETRVLTRDPNGRIVVTGDVVQYSFPDISKRTLDITQRRHPDDNLVCLYEKNEHTFVFAQDLEACVVLLLPFEDAPEHYRRYVTLRAARFYQDRAQTSQVAHATTSRDEIEAERWLNKHEGRQQTRTIFDSFDAARPLRRQYPRFGAR